MKKSPLILPILAVALTSNLYANPKSTSSVFESGIRVGLEGGYKRHSVKHKFDFTPSSMEAGGGLVPESRSKTATHDTGVFGIHLAYDWFINQFYASLEAAYRYAPGSACETLRLQNSDNVANNATEASKISQYHHHDILFNAHLGRTITNCFLLYGIVGLRVGFFEQKIDISENVVTPALILNNKRRDVKLGFGFGLGGRYGFENGWSLSAEGTYDIYGKVKRSKNLREVASNPVLRTGGQFFQSSKCPHMFNLILKVSKTL